MPGMLQDSSYTAAREFLALEKGRLNRLIVIMKIRTNFLSNLL